MRSPGNPEDGSRHHDRAFENLRKAVLDASALPESERATYLRESLEDPDLVAEAMSLLATDPGRADVVIEGAVKSALRDTLRPSAGGAAIGDSLGPYRLESVLGHGGMGVVYLAHQETPIDRRVALKLMTSGLMTPGVLKRFELEQHLLGQLDHPNIAKVLDASRTPDGCPYFVLEYVDGVPVTEYCSGRGLDLRERLVLFLQICRAVDHAHRRGVIHRDLKPSNILVARQDDHPLVKVIDFGIARAVEEEAVQMSYATLDGHVLGTPQYMSPEQARGERHRIDTRSDVYSLGVVLHELVTGALPYDLRTTSVLEVLRVVAHELPQTGRRTFAGAPIPDDLRNILAMALESEPDRRYGGVRLLADDIERYLDRRPVAARRPSTLYHLRKVAERHPAAAAFLVLLLVVSVGAAIGMSVLYRRQAVAHELADREAAKATAVGTYLEGILGAADPLEGGPDQPIGSLLEKAIGSAQRDLADQPGVRAAVLRTLGHSLTSLDRFKPGREALDAALAALDAADHEDPLEAARIQQGFAELERQVGDRKAAIAYAREGLERLVDAAGPVAEVRAGLYSELALSLRMENRFAEAESLATVARDFARTAFGPTSPQYIEATYNLGEILMFGHGDDRALDCVREAVELTEERYGRDSPRLVQRRGLLGMALFNANRREESIAVQRETLELCRRTFGATHSQTAECANNLATGLLNTGRFAEAEPYAEEALAIWEERLGPHHTYLVTAHNNLGYMALHQCKFSRAAEHLERAVAVLDSLPGAEVQAAVYVLASLAMARHALGRTAGALRAGRRSVAIVDSLVTRDHAMQVYPRQALSAILLDSGDLAGARRELDILEEWFSAHPPAAGQRGLFRLILDTRAARLDAAEGQVDLARQRILTLQAELLEFASPRFGLYLEVRRAADLLRSWGDDDLAAESEAWLAEHGCADVGGGSGR